MDDQVFSTSQVFQDYDEKCTFCPLRRKRKTLDNNTLFSERNPTRYWDKRHLLFSKYDQGVLLDETGWFSVTPERVAIEIAQLLPNNDNDSSSNNSNLVVYDGFAGLGGNAIQFALVGNHRVIAAELDVNRARLCRHNAKVYNAQVDLIIGDFFNLDLLNVDVVFASPPWGGPSVNDQLVFRLDDRMFELAKKARSMTKNLIIYLPRHTSILDLARLSESVGDDYFRVVIHRNEDQRGIVAISALFGPMFVDGNCDDPEPVVETKQKQKKRKRQKIKS